MKRFKRTALAAGLMLAATPALAHTGHGEVSGFLAGLQHPVTGLDHLLAMVSVGMWSALSMPKAAFRTPAVFVSAMIAGAALSFGGVGLPMVEGMIATSVFALGLMIVAGARLPSGLGVALIGLFALFHGHAHASEAAGAALAYVGGFSLATAILHITGVGLGQFLRDSAAARLTAGTVVVGSGLALLAGF